MKYINAKNVLPDCLIKELQEYTQGNYIYIPVKEGQHKDWGETTGNKLVIAKRNEKIISLYQNGSTVEELSEKYYLSIHAIRKILYS